ncbi:reverse transcriptase domain-containing protein [Tanacetum coccineum]
MSIQLADQPIKYLVGVRENLLVKINKFIFLVNFIVLEMDEDDLVLIILGRPFLATARAVIDVHKGKLSLRVGNETVTFNIGKSMKSKYREARPTVNGHWVSPVQVVPKKGGKTVVKNEKSELIPQRTVTGWRMRIYYRNLNNATRKDHFPFTFIDQMVERLDGYEYYYFLDGFLGYFQIPIALEDQDKNHVYLPV